MELSKKTYYYFFALLLFIALKFLFSNAENNAFLFLTKPTNAIISFITNSTSTYTNAIGFYNEKLNIIIDSSCAGLNFWLLCFILILFSFFRFLNARAIRLLAIPITLVAAYIITIFVNTSRIIISLIIENTLLLNYKWLHQAEGVFVYLSFLMLMHLFINYIQIKHIKQHA